MATSKNSISRGYACLRDGQYNRCHRSRKPVLQHGLRFPLQKLVMAFISGLSLSVMAACRQPQKAHSTDEQHGLSGVWRADFQMGLIRASHASGTLHLQASPQTGAACREDPKACGSAVRGFHTVDFSALLGQKPGAVATGAVLTDNSVLMLLGACCDRGEISMRGQFRQGRIVGRWTETRIGDERSGTFELRR